ncbi:MAG TPA: M28 family peptidase [Thermoanaerobaculia bacterium]|nr:M28 family peptidase [Thermoanaerobaculia bacterium]
MLTESLGRIAGLSAALVAAIVVASIVIVRQPSFSNVPRLLKRRADPDRLRTDIAFLTRDASPRDARHPEKLELAAAYIGAELLKSGAAVASQPYDVHGRAFRNVVARLGPRGPGAFVLGAHYDSFGETNLNPGADDNASGVAGLLEVARLLGSEPLARPLVLVAYCTEEPPYYHSEFMGSAVHAASLKDSDAPPIGMVSLEMIGYFHEKQPWPSPLFALAYPTRGDFIAVVGRWADRRLVKELRRGINAASTVAAYSYSGPAISGTEASDHSSYWAEGYTAAMVTDTAFMRNPNYHAPTDTLETLDFERMAQVVTGVANAAAEICGLASP